MLELKKSLVSKPSLSCDSERKAQTRLSIYKARNILYGTYGSLVLCICDCEEEEN